MKIEDIRNLPDEDIQDEIKKARQQIFKVRFRAKGAEVEKPGSLKGLRRGVARLFTVLRERAIMARKNERAESAKGKSRG